MAILSNRARPGHDMRGMGKPSPLKQIHGKDGNSYGKGNDMTHAFKPGDRAMVELGAGTIIGNGFYIGDGVSAGWVPSSALSPLPPSLTPEAQAVLDALDLWGELTKGHATPTIETVSATRSLELAVTAYRASLAHPDPVAEVIAAWKEYEDGDERQVVRLAHAITALEASRKP